MFSKRPLILLACALVGINVSKAESFTVATIAGLAGHPTPLDANGDGTNSGARFYSPAGLLVDPAGIVYIVDGHAIRRMSAAGTNWIVTTVAGEFGMHAPDDGTNLDARFDYPQSLAADSLGNLYVADAANNAIRMVTPIGTNWVVTTIAGNAAYPGTADGTNAAARFNHPYGVAVDQIGTLYVADSYNSTIRKIIPIGTNWVVSTIAGLATNSGTADGTNTAARFNGPSQLVIEGGTNIYVADFNNHAIRSITTIGTNWVVKTIAGLAGTSGSADGTNTAARFFLPQGICEDTFGNLYVSDSGNNAIRKLKHLGTNWVVVTIAGNPEVAGTADGTGSGALFNQPYGIGCDSAGRLFVADSVNVTVRLGRVALALDLRLTASQLSLAWPIAATNYVLEMNSNPGAGGTWFGLTNGISLSGDTYSFQTNTAASKAFFRLHKP
jgi:secreted PhoX family phosphatase